jgi:hypothetical protein
MAKLFSRYNLAIRNRAVLDAWDTSTNTLSPVSYLEYITFSGAAASFVQNTAYPIYTAPNDGKTWKVVGISYRFTVQSTGASTFGVEIAGAAVAPGSGTLQTGALTLQGTANTTINGTLLTFVASTMTVSPGSSVNLVVTNTAATTGLAGLVVTLSLQRIT